MTECRLPAEWEPQAGVMLTWPHANTDWASVLSEVLPVFAQIGAAITRDEALLSVCRDVEQEAQIRSALESADADPDKLFFAHCRSDDTWARDYGPISTLGGNGTVLNDFIFDGWGGKFAADNDTAISRSLHDQRTFGVTPMRSHDLVLEGGAIETNGQGTLLATRSSVLDPKRNPGQTQASIELTLCETLGLDHFLWLDHGSLTGDDTDGHIDVLARFTDEQTIVCTSAPPGDPDHASLEAMYTQLRAFRDKAGRSYHIHRLPFAGALHASDGRRLPASYANFLITNHSVLMPGYGVEADAAAADLLQACFPGRRTICIDCRSIIEQNGSLHCLTMQFPVGVTLQHQPGNQPQ